MNIIFKREETVYQLEAGDLIREETGGIFMVVAHKGKYGYMNIETGVLVSCEYDTPQEMFVSCFVPDEYGCVICEFGDVEIKKRK